MRDESQGEGPGFRQRVAGTTWGSWTLGLAQKALTPFKAAWTWIKWWGLVWLAWGISLPMVGLIWWFQGGRPVGFAVVGVLAVYVAVWFAIKVYYVEVWGVEVNRSGRLKILKYMVPIERSSEIEIDGSVGMLEDRYGSEIRIVRNFNIETMSGEGTWPVLTPIEIAAEWRRAEEAVMWTEKQIMRFGVASIGAHLEAAGNYIKIAEYADQLLKLPELDTNDVMHEERERTNERGVKRGSLRD